MPIATIVTRGYGNGTYTGTIPFVVTRGYSIAAPPSPDCYLNLMGVIDATDANLTGAINTVNNLLGVIDPLGQNAQSVINESIYLEGRLCCDES